MQRRGTTRARLPRERCPGRNDGIASHRRAAGYERTGSRYCHLSAYRNFGLASSHGYRGANGCRYSGRNATSHRTAGSHDAGASHHRSDDSRRCAYGSSGPRPANGASSHPSASRRRRE